MKSTEIACTELPCGVFEITMPDGFRALTVSKVELMKIRLIYDRPAFNDYARELCEQFKAREIGLSDLLYWLYRIQTCHTLFSLN